MSELFARDDLQQLQEWLISKGWQIHPTKGEYEVLRATKSNRDHPFILYRKKNISALSVADRDVEVITSFYESQRVPCITSSPSRSGFPAEVEGMSSVDILNFYRNLYHAEPDTTERGIVARAINDILPGYIDFVEHQRFKDSGAALEFERAAKTISSDHGISIHQARCFVANYPDSYICSFHRCNHCVECMKIAESKGTVNKKNDSEEENDCELPWS